jgi:hypothetical protein
MPVAHWRAVALMLVVLLFHVTSRAELPDSLRQQARFDIPFSRAR